MRGWVKTTDRTNASSSSLQNSDQRMRGVRRIRVLAGAIALFLAGGFVQGFGAQSQALATPTLRFDVITKTTQKLDSLLWTGRHFLYVQNTANTVWAAPAAGHPLKKFATMPRLVEETRCVLSPGRHGFPSGTIFCHSPDNPIYEISPNRSSVTVFASLPAPYPPVADGGLAFDTVGRFGHRLVAATGRSGAPHPAGGLVYTIDPHGRVQRVGSYGGPGGADELVIAPSGFGSVAGDALLTVDAGAKGGAVVAIDSGGKTRTIATFPEGPNPIAPIPKMTEKTGAPHSGLYLNDDVTSYTYLAPSASLARYAGDVIVGTEAGYNFWILKPEGNGFTKMPLRDNLPAGNHGLEQAIFVSS
jgi:hypothetical protein